MTDAAPGSPPPAGDLDHTSTLTDPPGEFPTAVAQQVSAAAPSAASAASPSAHSVESTSTSPVGIPVIGVTPMA
ncbi:hypothetical protein, partial [Actinomyces sp.]